MPQASDSESRRRHARGLPGELERLRFQASPSHWGDFAVKEDEAFDPVDVAFFGAVSVVPEASGVAHLVEQLFGLSGTGK